MGIVIAQLLLVICKRMNRMKLGERSLVGKGGDDLSMDRGGIETGEKVSPGRGEVK
jgi:hypothetical protein